MSRFRSISGSRSLAAAISAALAAVAPAVAEDALKVLDAVTVTATRRSENIQDVPLNIAAVSSDLIQEKGINNLAEMARSVPGLFVIDQGARASNAIIVRGLNADPIGGTEGLGNGGGGTVATYVGEIPLYIDLKPSDIERVEILLGPQGTLYGAGTLGGAIRYIPKRPLIGASTLDLRADGYTLSESEGFGSKGGFTVNLPLGGSFAFRGSLDYLNDPGFIDYNFVVRDPGVSDPEPDFSNPAAVANNLRREEDADFQKAVYGRAALRWEVTEAIDINLTYYYQNQEVGGRTLNQQVSFGTGRYESAQRYLEPNERKNRLTALELTADLGFAELTSATGYSEFTEFGQRDQTDLLIALQYSYEAFPSFSAFTREDQEEKTLNQEVRLVSTSEGALQWIAGAFYNHFKGEGISKEFTPHYSEYLLSVGATGVLRTDDLEYLAVDKADLTETALYGEVSYDITAQWQATIGGRWYKYKLDTKTATDLPLLESTVLGSRGPNDIVLNFQDGGQDDDGTLFKFNTRYEFTDDIMAYLTISEGYRIGNSNGIPLCTGPGTVQNVCGSPRELQYFPDSTTNYEIGVRTQLFDRRLTLNGSIYYVDWQDPQLNTATAIGAAPITINGEGATSRGIELSFDAQVTDALSLSGNYGYVDAKLSERAVDLIRTIDLNGANGPFTPDFVDGEVDDRLPGSPKHQGSFYAAYSVLVGAVGTLKLNYGVTAASDIVTRVGTRGGGEALGGFTLHSASAVFEIESWTIGLYAKNLFDKYAETGVRSSRPNVQTVTDENGDPVRVRSYSKDVVRPREVGMRFTYKFDL